MRACMHAVMSATKHGSETLARSPPASGGSEKEPLQVRIPTGVKRAFKSLAALRGIEPNALFVEVWEHYERTGPKSGTGEKHNA